MNPTSFEANGAHRQIRPCEWQPVDKLPTVADGTPYFGTVLLLMPHSPIGRWRIPHVFEGHRVGNKLVYADLQVDIGEEVPAPVAWCRLPSWPLFVEGEWA
jgi:hypothetical protein